MAGPQERMRVRLKFKRFLLKEGPLMPQGYRLATCKEIKMNLDMFKKWELPVKSFISSTCEEGSGNIRLLDGWVPAGFNDVREEFNFSCSWNAVVKKKKLIADKWQNCREFYSSNGNSLRKELYNGIPLSREGKKVAWLHAYCYEDVELMHWLWRFFPHSIRPDYFTTECRPQRIFMDIPLREMVRRLENCGPGSQLEMTNAETEVQAVLRNAKDQSRDGSHNWCVATIELAIDIYGNTFKNEAALLVFENAIDVLPITAKFLSLLLQGDLEIQIAQPQYPVAEVLIEAVKKGYSPLVTEIMTLRHGITHITRDEYVEALKEAVCAGHKELVECLLNSRDPDMLRHLNQVDEEEKTLFHYALTHEPVFSLLEDKYANSFDNIITRQDKFGRNVLHWAAKKGYDSRVVDRLLRRFTSRECLIHSKDHQRRTPSHIAAFKGDIGMIEKLLHNLGNADSPRRINYIQTTDSSGRTALLIAASEGHDELVKMLLDKGSCPLKERDGQRKTALHHAAKVKNPKAALATCKALLEHDSPSYSSPKRLLLFWASATGIGTAHEMKDVHDDVRNYLKLKKGEYNEPLLAAAAINNDFEMVWELLSRGANIADIHDLDRSNGLRSHEKESVKNVLSHIERMKEQGRDQPSMEDKLGRYVFAQGLAALFLDRFIESPITVGISGEWGMGKSSLMLQTEKILLITAAQLTFPNLLPREEFTGFKNISLSTRGETIYQQINRGVNKLLDRSKNDSKEQNPLVTLLKEYQPRHHDVYKALACMDNNQMLQLSSVSRQQEQEHAFRGIPRILTIQYNAWHYRNEHEAWAGLGVTISKGIEKAMTRAQWMSTCWRYTWAKQRVNIWIQLFLPSLLSIFLAGWVAWIAWMLLKQAKFHGLKYGSIPLTITAIVWVVLKSVSSVVKPVSTQMLGYVTVPDHTSHLGYQEDVINDINFLKTELGKKPHLFFSFILWCWNWFGLYADNVESTSIPKCMPASGHDIRIVTFVDDLDRCEEKVVLKVLSAINLVLAECKINVILGMDKKMIERAIEGNFQNPGGDLAEKFIRKIIQIPLSLPDPTNQESNRFLEYHLRHKIPEEYRENKSVSKSQCGLVTEEAEEPAGSLVTEEAEEPAGGSVNRPAESYVHIPSDENLYSLRSAEGVRLIREILLPNYTREEAHLFYELKKFTTGNQKLPREWKCLLSYHKFAWYVLSLIGKVYSLPTWKEELVAWVFVCWQWKREMNHLIKVWNTDTIEQDNGRNRGGSQGPSLGELVTSCMSQLPNADPSEVNWSKFKKALEKQDVSMEGIQLFQQFRLHCEIDRLPLPHG